MASMNTKRVDLGQYYGSQDNQDMLTNPKKDVMRRLYQQKKVEEASHQTSIAIQEPVDSPQFSYI